jgi:hypothetical protein
LIIFLSLSAVDRQTASLASRLPIMIRSEARAKKQGPTRWI